MNFKFLTNNQEEITLIADNQLNFYQPRRYNNVEFCFQFGEDEPVIFGTGGNDLHIHVSPTEHGNITFNDNGKTFKIFARERQNEN